MSPPSNPKPLKPKLRGERWELGDGRKVVFLDLLGIDNLGNRSLEVLNERGALEAVYERQFRKRLYPPEEA